MPSPEFNKFTQFSGCEQVMQIFNFEDISFANYISTIFIIINRCFCKIKVYDCNDSQILISTNISDSTATLASPFLQFPLLLSLLGKC